MVLLICLCACNKKSNSESIDTLTIYNKFSQEMFVNIYATKERYNNNSNGYKYVVPANGELAIRFNPFANDTSYFIDWYNSDFTITNWGKTESRFNPTGNNTDKYILELNNANATSYTSASRAVWLNGTKTITRWKSVDVYGRGRNGNLIPISNFLNDDQKFFEVDVRKDFTGSYRRILSNGKPYSEELIFTPGYLPLTDKAMLKTVRNEPVVLLTSNFSTATTDYYSASNDTILAYMAIDTLTFFKMVRQ